MKLVALRKIVIFFYLAQCRARRCRQIEPAIEAYTQMIGLIGDKDPTTKRMIEDILSSEQAHADELKDWLTAD